MGKDLLDAAMTAHGGLGRWEALHAVQAEVSLTGLVWERSQQPALVKHLTLLAETREERLTLSPFSSPDRRCVFEPNRVVLESFDGQVIDSRENPRAAFSGPGNKTNWDVLDTAFFAAYTLWNVLTAPFLYSYPGFSTEELSPWRENDEVWRRLRITFPQGVAMHSREQISYFGPDGLLRRHDFQIGILGDISLASYPSNYREFSGIYVPTSRRVFLSASGQQTIGSPLKSSTQISSLQFT
jgi:hypothetical protein